MPQQSRKFSIRCRGRDVLYRPVLQMDVRVTLQTLVLEDDTRVSLSVICPHNEGHPSTICKASNNDGVRCPYTIELPKDLDTQKV